MSYELSESLVNRTGRLTAPGFRLTGEVNRDAPLLPWSGFVQLGELVVDSGELGHDDGTLMNPFQLKLIDLFWATSLIACVVGAVTTSTPEIAFIGLSCVLLFVWRRPVLLRFWTLAVVGLGVGLFMAGYKDGYALGLPSSDVGAWGGGMAIGGGLAFVLFDVRKPPEIT